MGEIRVPSIGQSASLVCYCGKDFVSHGEVGRREGWFEFAAECDGGHRVLIIVDALPHLIPKITVYKLPQRSDFWRTCAAPSAALEATGEGEGT